MALRGGSAAAEKAGYLAEIDSLGGHRIYGCIGRDAAGHHCQDDKNHQYPAQEPRIRRL